MTTINNGEGGLSVRLKLNTALAVVDALDADLQTFQLPANTTISSYGATLIDDANAAGARTTLGLGTAATSDVTTTSTDTTAGRLTKVGDFGVGVTEFTPPVADLDAADIPTGFYFYNSADVGTFPLAGVGSILQLRRRNSEGGQIAMPSNTEGRAFVRGMAGSAWGLWREIYHQGSILGTVSQSAGVPTGAVIQRGSNANGEFVKFADGTMIAITSRKTTDVTDVRGNGYNSPALAETSPVTFHTTASTASMATVESQIVWGNFRTLTVDSFDGRIHAWTSQSGITYQVVGIGRWF